MIQAIAFYRGDYKIIADILKTVIEPLGESHQVVFFCREGDRVYRVPKSEALWVRTKKVKAKKRRKVVA